MFLNFLSFYQVVRPLGRKSVNKYLYLYLYLYPGVWAWTPAGHESNVYLEYLIILYFTHLVTYLLTLLTYFTYLFTYLINFLILLTY